MEIDQSGEAIKREDLTQNNRKNPKFSSINYNSSQGEAQSHNQQSERQFTQNLNKNSYKEGITRLNSGLSETQQETILQNRLTPGNHKSKFMGIGQGPSSNDYLIGGNQRQVFQSSNQRRTTRNFIQRPRTSYASQPRKNLGISGAKLSQWQQMAQDKKDKEIGLGYSSQGSQQISYQKKSLAKQNSELNQQLFEQTAALAYLTKELINAPTSDYQNKQVGSNMGSYKIIEDAYRPTQTPPMTVIGNKMIDRDSNYRVYQQYQKAVPIPNPTGGRIIKHSANINIPIQKNRNIHTNTEIVSDSYNQVSPGTQNYNMDINDSSAKESQVDPILVGASKEDVVSQSTGGQSHGISAICMKKGINLFVPSIEEASISRIKEEDDIITKRQLKQQSNMGIDELIKNDEEKEKRSQISMISSLNQSQIVSEQVVVNEKNTNGS